MSSGVFNHSQVLYGNKSEDNRTKTTNHLYFHPGHHSGEFENWMRKVGGLLQINKEYSSLKPLLDMLVTVLEPSRIFLIPHMGIEKFEVKPHVEIILVLTDWKDFEDKKLIEGILMVVSMKYCEVGINVFSEEVWDDSIEKQHVYFLAHCRSEFLVFSGNPYRIREAEQDSLNSIKSTITELFEKEVAKSTEMLNQSEALFTEQTNPDLIYGITSTCLKQFYRMIIKPFLLDLPLISHSCTELINLASRIIPQVKNLKIKNIDLYTTLVEEGLGDNNNQSQYLPDFEELQNSFDLLKVAFEQKITILFETK